MAQPLDYRNPLSKASSDDSRAVPVAHAVIPADFDFVLTNSNDHAAVRAIENELRRRQIGVFRAEDDSNAQRRVQLLIRSADQKTAGEIAAKIFARRKRIKAFPRQEPIPDPGPLPIDKKIRHEQ